MDVEFLREQDEATARQMLANCWRGDAAVLLGFAGALLTSGKATTVEQAIAVAMETWVSLLRDEELGALSVASPGGSAIEGLHRQLLRDPSAC